MGWLASTAPGHWTFWAAGAPVACNAIWPAAHIDRNAFDHRYRAGRLPGQRSLGFHSNKVARLLMRLARPM